MAAFASISSVILQAPPVSAAPADGSATAYDAARGLGSRVHRILGRLAPRSRAGRADDDTGQLPLVETRTGALRRIGRQMSEAGAYKHRMSEGLSRLQRQGRGAELVRGLGARALRHRAGEARSGEGTHLDRPIAAAGLGGRARLLP